MFVIKVQYVKPLTEIDRLLNVHRDHLALYFDAGKLLASGPQEPREGGLILGLFSDREECDAFIQMDPFYKEKVAEYTVTEFVPNRAHDDAKFLIDHEATK